jgi:retinol dehydrogenase-12
MYIGIGFETAKALASMKPRKLIMACRNSEKAQAAVKSIQDASNFREVEAWSLDLASFASVQEFAKKFLATGLPLDVLVSNAGVGTQEWATTTDGYEVVYVFLHLPNLFIYLFFKFFKFFYNYNIVYK